MKKESEKYIDSNFFEGIVSIRAIAESILAGTTDRRFTRMLFAKEKVQSKAKELGWLKYLSSSMHFPLEIVQSEELDALCIGSTHGGVAAYCTDRTTPALSDISIPERGFYVMIEGIEDPYNFGNALRSLYAAGADGIVLPPRNWMTAAGVVCRSSAGTSERFSMAVSDAVSAAEFFKERGYKIVCADIADSVSVYDADLSRPLFLIVGGEKRGISRAVLQKADIIVRLDYGREFSGALSAASAASILGYEVLRQNRI